MNLKFNSIIYYTITNR